MLITVFLHLYWLEDCRDTEITESILSRNQSAYGRNRYMGYNVRLVEYVIEYYEQIQKRGIIFMVDFTKAFDSLECIDHWNSLTLVLPSYNGTCGEDKEQWSFVRRI